MATNMDLLKKIQALEAWKTIASGQIATLQQKVATLEGASTVDLSAIEGRISGLEEWKTVMDAKTCPEESRFQTIEGALAVLNPDHVPE